MNEIMNDVVVVTIRIFGKSLNYKEDSAQNFIFVLLFTYLIYNFSIKYQSRDIMDCCCMRLVLSEDLGSVNPRHKIYMYICGMLLLVTLMT